MKLVTLLILAFSSFTFANPNGKCALNIETYTTKNHIDYLLVGLETYERGLFSNVKETLTITDEDQFVPLYFSVSFDPFDNQIKGQMSIVLDQVMGRTEGSVPLDQALNLKLEDAYNGGKTVYELECTSTSYNP